ncbi:MAG TPA: hypothetical protein VFF32_02430 [Dermatophilaceae bacterium]|nr:hypothetical protein [Dermatophilaceae bacterium]
MNGVLADKTAHDTARQFAKFYNARDKANKSKQETDIKTVQFYCSLQGSDPGTSSTYDGSQRLLGLRSNSSATTW